MGQMARSQLSVEEAAQRLRVTPQRVRSLIAAKRLPADRVGVNYLLDADDVVAFGQRERRAGRPLSAKNAWALLAQLSGRPKAALVSRSTSYRLRRLLEQGGEELADALALSQPRSEWHAWRVLPSDFAKLNDDLRLVPTGLAAADAWIDIRYQPERDGIDAYVSQDDLRALERRFQPEKRSRASNVLLRVPRNGTWILDERRSPIPVAAADLLDHRDPRVRRAARAALGLIVHGG